MTLEEYIQYRTGETEVTSIIRGILVKPFTSLSLRAFWNYWNPGFGYFLLFYCYKPIRSIAPHWLSLIITFLICGLLHDMMYVIPMMIVNGAGFVFPFITVWFLIIAIGILISELLHIDFRKISKSYRPILHIVYLVGTFCLTRYIDIMIG